MSNLWTEKNNFVSPPKFDLQKAINHLNEKHSLRVIFQFYSLYLEYNPTQSGWTEKACCPFPDHNDDTASFYFHPEKNIFYCFGCQKSGGPVQFVSFYGQVSFLEALKIIVEKNFPSQEIKSQISDVEKEKEIVFLLSDFVCRVQPKINISNFLESEKNLWILQCFLREKTKLSEVDPFNLQLLFRKIESRF